MKEKGREEKRRGRRRRRREGGEDFEREQRYGIVWNSKVLYGFPWNYMDSSSLFPNLGFC